MSSTIPKDVLEKYITNELKMNILNEISFLRVSPMNQLFGHILSFCLQVIASGDTDTSTLPGSFQLIHEDRIFIIFDEFTCFKCKAKGHRADDCTAIPVEIINPTLSNEQFPEFTPTAMNTNKTHTPTNDTSDTHFTDLKDTNINNVEIFVNTLLENKTDNIRQQNCFH